MRSDTPAMKEADEIIAKGKSLEALKNSMEEVSKLDNSQFRLTHCNTGEQPFSQHLCGTIITLGIEAYVAQLQAKIEALVK